MAYLITPNGLEKTKSTFNKIEYEGEIYTTGNFALHIGVSAPTITTRVKRRLNGEIDYRTLVSPQSAAARISIVDGNYYNVKQLVKMTKYSAQTVCKRMQKYNDGEITKEELLEVNKKVRITRDTVTMKVPKREQVAGKKRIPVEELNADYKVQLRKHKLNSGHVWGGMK